MQDYRKYTIPTVIHGKVFPRDLRGKVFPTDLCGKVSPTDLGGNLFLQTREGMFCYLGIPTLDLWNTFNKSIYYSVQLGFWFQNQGFKCWGGGELYFSIKILSYTQIKIMYWLWTSYVPLTLTGAKPNNNPASRLKKIVWAIYVKSNHLIFDIISKQTGLTDWWRC